MVEPLLKVEGLRAGYGEIQVLWGLDIDVPAGEITCIIGSNGAGKTTLLRVLSGVLPTTSGRISFSGENVTDCDAAASLSRGIVHVPEGRRLFRGMSVRNNLLVGAYLRRDKAEIKRDLDFVFSIFPILQKRFRQDATTLSGGEQQMCAIGRGLMSKPKLLMIDELSLGLAPMLVERLGQALTEVNKNGLTILIVEQDVMTALELASHGFVVEQGRVEICGSTQMLAKNPLIRQAYLGM
jgi:branched-chain amino acid transport system ATP-binding protein